MSAHRACWIECDECGNNSPSDMGAETIAHARAGARSQGWGRRKGKDVCFDCLAEEATS